MTSTLKYYIPQEHDPSFSDAFKKVLQDVHGNPVNHQFTEEDLAMLRGIRNGTRSDQVRRDANNLIDLVILHGRISVEETW